MKKKKDNNTATAAPRSKERLRKAMERTATFGLLLVAAGLVAPLAGPGSPVIGEVFKWIYAAGALIYTVARGVNVNDAGDGFRVRRLRRLEMWAGFAFCIGSAFWFYNATKWGGSLFTLKLLQETILFTLVGAMIQIVASWMLVSALKKQNAPKSDGNKKSDTNKNQNAPGPQEDMKQK